MKASNFKVLTQVQANVRTHIHMLEFQTLRDLEVHTEATLAALDQARKR